MKLVSRTLLALAALVSFDATAAAIGGFTTADAGIVMPDVATGMRAYVHYVNTVDGLMVVCRYDDYSRGTCGGEGWKTVQSVVPAGRVYVGFRIVSGSYGVRQLEVYWK